MRVWKLYIVQNSRLVHLDEDVGLHIVLDFTEMEQMMSCFVLLLELYLTRFSSPNFVV